MKIKNSLLFLFFILNISINAKEYYGIEIPNKYYNTIIEYCTEYKVPIIYVTKLIEWESNWDESCITINRNGTKDYGLMKHNSNSLDDFSRWYNNGNKYDPLNWNLNLKIGIMHLANLRKQTGSWFGALAAYNMGLFGYTEWRNNKRVMPEETKKELEFIIG